jgi:hypothetical protein
MLENPNPMFNEEWSARKWAVLQCQVRRFGKLVKCSPDDTRKLALEQKTEEKLLTIGKYEKTGSIESINPNFD